MRRRWRRRLRWKCGKEERKGKKVKEMEEEVRREETETAQGDVEDGGGEVDLTSLWQKAKLMMPLRILERGRS